MKFYFQTEYQQDVYFNQQKLRQKKIKKSYFLKYSKEIHSYNYQFSNFAKNLKFKIFKLKR